jgi:hypothetical protein
MWALLSALQKKLSKIRESKARSTAVPVQATILSPIMKEPGRHAIL